MENESLGQVTGQEWIRKSIEITASDDKVWTILTDPEQVKLWAGAFEPGTQVASDWQEGSVVIWKDKDGVPAMKGKVMLSYAGKILKLAYYNDVNAADDAELDAYEEHYLLAEHEGKTDLTIESGPLTDEYIKKIAPQWDEALKIIKQTAEQQ